MEKDEREPVYVLYVGSKLYTPDKFEKEARKYGVSRAIPPTVAKKLEPGTKIYCAWKRKKFSMIYGYFIYSGININAPPEFWEYFNEHKNEFGILYEDNSNEGMAIERGCGSYIAGTSYAVSDLKQTVQKILELAKEHGWKIKIFATGKYYRLPKPIRVNIPFSRSVVQYYLKLDSTSEKIDTQEISEMQNYHQIKYRKKGKRKSKQN